MDKIRILPQTVADKIAAGEVAERPSAVVKELVENSIDAGADRITVEISHGGISMIRVEDNGCGIAADELETAFIRHATSKIRDIDDLFSIATMGFRGEALASICAVADVEVFTRTENEDEGVHMTMEHGIPSEKSAVMCGRGTTMVIENLFANIPARMKFMKKDSTESGYVSDVLSRIALSRPDISFTLISDGKEQFSTTGDGRLENTVLKIYGVDIARGVLAVDYSEVGISVRGVVGKPELARGNRTRQTLFVNGRYIKNHVAAKVVEEAYRNMLMTGKFPFFVLNIELSPQLVDVNVHPAKTEIKFANEKQVYEVIHRAVKNALYAAEKRELPEMSANDRIYAKPEQPTERLHKADGSFEPKAYLPEKPDRALISEILDSMKNGEKQRMVFNENSQDVEEDVFAEPNSTEYTAMMFKTDETVKPVETDKQQLDKVDETENGFVQVPETTRIVGQVFDTYVIAERGGEMFMIDQHAAHERQRFEILKRDYEAKGASGQSLLVPIVLDVDRGELRTILDNSETLSRLGFSIEEFGKGTVIIRETPYIGSDEEIKNLVLELLPILEDGRPSGLMSFEERMLDTVSCRYAIKANKRLSGAEMQGLVKMVEELEAEGIKTCPHGRPIKVRFTKREIEKMFKRIV